MNEASTSRRDFLAGSALTAAALSTGGVFAKGDDTIKIGLVGCGGRGTGAAVNALRADKNIQLVAMADAFGDKLEEGLGLINKKADLKGKVAVTPDTRFVGFDGYKRVIELSDVVLLCTPPQFRPLHLKAAVEAGKHIFCEKPVAVDAPGIRSVIATAQEAKKKGISLVSGFCYRYDLAKRETIKRIHDGAIGDISAIQITYNTGPLWDRSIAAPIDSMEFQMRNWYYFNWLSGDHIVEQHVHNFDKASWVLKGELPTFAVGTGGRQLRTDAKFGNIFDHHAVIFEFKDGKRMFSFCRQQPGCTSEVSDHILGTKGRAELMSHTIKADQNWTYQGEAPDMYQQEHDELFAAIRAGKILNDGVEAAYSTMMAIMGRMATYSGKRISWDQAFNSKEDLTPAKYQWGPLAVAPVPVPGTTKVL
jgi:myo-inositol 2-dehydrogenase/D-chiro-inositol 1-dehydrogenase